jgi:hypothetical protein
LFENLYRKPFHIEVVFSLKRRIEILKVIK